MAQSRPRPRPQRRPTGTSGQAHTTQKEDVVRPTGSSNALEGIAGVKAEQELFEVVEKPTFGERLASVRDRLKMGPHHKMERFGIILGATLICTTGVIGTSFASYQHKMTNVATETAKVSPDFTFSKTQQGGKIIDVFGNTKHTDVFVLFQFGDIKTMSAEAKNYQVFITGEQENLDPEEVPKGEFGLFGSTGYGYVRFSDTKRIENGTLRVTLRANKTLATNTGEGSVTSDATDAKYDQATFLVNPGATKLVASGLAFGESDPVALYRSLVAEAADAKVRETIATKTVEMASLINKSKEYENRIRSAGYIPPAAPKFMVGDYVEGETLHAASNVYNAHPLDYTKTKLTDGYLTQVLKTASSFDAYMAQWREKEGYDKGSKAEELERPERLKGLKGDPLNLETVIDGESPSAQVGVRTAAYDLFDVYQQYLADKREIQRSQTYKMLVIDADIQSQPTTFSKVSSPKKHIFFY